jgi:hypothetical protein
MHTHHSKYLQAGFFSLLFCIATSLFGQGFTTAGISGFVTDKDGHPVAGATVTALNTPTGTHKTAVTRSNGEYNIDGLQPGGPYSVTVAGSGFSSAEQDGYSLTVGTNTGIDFKVTNEVVKLEAVTVEEGRDPTFDSQKIGTGMSFNSDEIQSVSSIRRDIQDIQNLDPRVMLVQEGPAGTEYMFSVQGMNPRENGFLIDGVSAADNFGLNTNGYAGFRNPLPPDWINSLSIDLNPFDIVDSTGVGATTTATTKSGTNDFHGSVYEIYTGTRFRGPDPSITTADVHETFQNHTSGATLGGPIIKDKLFFFVGYDAFREMAQSPAQLFNPADNAADTAVLNSIVQQTINAYHYNPGAISATAAHSWEQNFIAKIDWNINDANHFEVTFRHTAGETPNFYNYSSSFETSLSNSWYQTYRVDQSLTAKLNSDWSAIIPNFTTEVEATYKRYNGTAILPGGDFPGVTIANVPGTSTAGAAAGVTELFLGTYPAYQLNNIYTWEQEEHAYGEYSWGNHTFKFGSQFDRTGYTDTFVPNYLGSYTFTNVADYLANAPTQVKIEQPWAGYTLASDVSHYYMLDVSPLIQDTWKPNSQLTVVAGVREDYPYEPQRPIFSQLFYNAEGFSNTGTVNGHYTVSPRLGFNYTIPGKLKTQIRGGAGLFLGQNPVVWTENAFNNAGQLTLYSYPSSHTPIANYSLVPVPGNTPPTTLKYIPPPAFDDVAPDFHWPANWKENLAIDQDLPWLGMIASAEIDLSQVEKDIYQTSDNLLRATPNTRLPDGAILYAGGITANFSSNTPVPGGVTYPSAFSAFEGSSGPSSSGPGSVQANPNIGQVYTVRNTDKGGSQVYTLSIHRPVKDGWGFSLAYAHTHATQVAQQPSSVAGSNESDVYYINPNDNIPYPSQYEQPDKFVGTLTGEYNFFKTAHAKTRLSWQFIASTGQQYSAVFYGDADGAGGTNQNLFYVPTGPSDPKVSWYSPIDETNFFNWLAGTPDIAKFEGHIVPRNALHTGEERYLNLHLEQEIPIWRDVRITAFADCFNFLNLLDNNWGRIQNYDNSFDSRPIAGTIYLPAANNGQGQYEYAFNAVTLGLPSIYPDQSRWNIDVGIRLEF